jgi:hypothetical protein
VITLKDLFKMLQYKEISIGGYKCRCCCEVTGRKSAMRKKELHKRARKRLKEVSSKEIDELNKE